jgi:O-antigen/teichoic acid export membrane protein
MTLQRSTTGWFLANVASSVLNFIAVVFFSRVLGAAILGTYFMFFSLVQVLNYIGNGGLSGATIKRISEGNKSPSLLGASFLMRSAFFSVIAVGIILCHNQLTSFLQGDFTYPLIIILFLLQISDLIREVLQGIHRVGISAWVDFVQQAGKIAAQVGLVGYGIMGLIVGLITGILASIGCGYAYIRITLSWPKYSDISDLFRFSRFAYGNSVGGLVFDWIGILAIGLFLGSTAAAVYGVCWSISVMVLLFSQAIATSLFPQVSRFHTIKNQSGIHDTLSMCLSYSPLLALPAFFGVIAVGSRFLSTVYGPDFSAGALVLVVLMATRVIQSLQMVICRTLEGLNRPDIEFWITLLTVSINLLSMVFFIQWYGAVGGALSSLITISISLILNAWMLHRIIPIEMTSPIFWIAGAAVVMFIVVLALVRIFPQTTIISLAGIILAGVVVYGGIIFMNREARGLIQDLVMRYSPLEDH